MKKTTSLFFLVPALALVFLTFFACKPDIDGNRIQPYIDNNSYWQYNGQPVFLLGSNKVSNPFQMEPLELKTYLDELEAMGGNYFRNIMTDREPGRNARAFKKLDNGKYDLSQWNDEYWDKLRNMLKWSLERDIIVHLTLWDRFDHYDQTTRADEGRARLWIDGPWNPVNNINYTMEETGLDSTYVGNAAYGTNPFFQTPPTMNDIPLVLHFQEKFVEKIIDISLGYQNVIYNMGNEHQINMKDWDMHWVQFVRDYASGKGHQIETTAMFDHVMFKDGEMIHVQGFSPIIEGSDIFTFIEGSKVGSQWTDPGEAQYDAAIELISHTADIKKRPVNAVKVRTQNIVYNAQERLWRPLMAGFAALSHHRNYKPGTTSDGWPIGGLAFTELAKSNIKAMRIFTDIIRPWECESRQDLLIDREEDEAYLMANEGETYGLYFPKGSGKIGLDLYDQKKIFKVQWIDIGEGQVVLESNNIEGGNIVSIETPCQVEYGWACTITVSGNK